MQTSLGAADKISNRMKEDKEQQLQNPVLYCIDNGCKDYAEKAVWKFPLVTRP